MKSSRIVRGRPTLPHPEKEDGRIFRALGVSVGQIL